MRDDLLLYYERELSFLRQMGAEFAAKYPKIASRLVLEPDKCEDPHVERMLEAFAFLAGRVHLKIDDEFPEITESLLSILYPHYLRPIPSMSIAQFHVDADQVTPETGLTLERGSVLNSRPVHGIPCKFRTCYDVTFWPVEVAEAEWKTPDRLQPAIKFSDAAAAVRIELRCQGDLPFSKMSLDSLRFYISGESNLTYTLYEAAVNNCVQVIVRDPTPRSKIQPVYLSHDSLKAVGFGEDEGMLPYPAALVRGIPAAPGVLLLAAEVLLHRFDRARRDRGGRVREARRSDFSDFAVRARRPPAGARAWG